jgi:formate dehydrogenase alpha subunit
MLDMGIMPDMLPGYQPIDQDGDFVKVWGRPLPKDVGKNSEEILEGIEDGSIRALYLMGCNPVQDFPEPKRWEEGLKKLSWLAVQDIFPNAATDIAQYVFPATTFAEKAGTFTSGERRVQKFEAAVKPHGNALPDWKIIQMFAQQLDYPVEYSDTATLAKEIGALVPQYFGLNYASLSRKGILWGPNGFEGSPFIPVDSLSLALAALHLENPSEESSQQANEGDGEGAKETKEYVLVTGSAMDHSGTLSTYAAGPNTLGAEAWVEVNSNDAQTLGVKNGDKVTVSEGDAAIKAPAKVTDSIPAGVVFVPNNFRSVPVNAFLGRRNSCRVEVKKG